MKIFAAKHQTDRYRRPGRAAHGNIETTTNALTIKNGFFINTAVLNNCDGGNEEIEAHRGSSVCRPALQRTSSYFDQNHQLFSRQLPVKIIEIRVQYAKELSTKLTARTSCTLSLSC